MYDLFTVTVQITYPWNSLWNEDEVAKHVERTLKDRVGDSVRVTECVKFDTRGPRDPVPGDSFEVIDGELVRKVISGSEKPLTTNFKDICNHYSRRKYGSGAICNACGYRFYGP